MAFGEKSPMQSPSSSYFSQAPAANLSKLLGWTYSVNGNTYKVVKAGGAITAAVAQSHMLLDDGSTAKTNIVTVAAGAAATRDTFAGMGSPSQIALVSGDFFLVQTGGRASFIAAAAGSTAHVTQICGAAGTLTDITDDALLGLTAALWSQIVGVSHQTRTSGQVGEVELEDIA